MWRAQDRARSGQIFLSGIVRMEQDFGYISIQCRGDSPSSGSSRLVSFKDLERSMRKRRSSWGSWGGSPTRVASVSKRLQNEDWLKASTMHWQKAEWTTIIVVFLVLVVDVIVVVVIPRPLGLSPLVVAVPVTNHDSSARERRGHATPRFRFRRVPRSRRPA